MGAEAQNRNDINRPVPYHLEEAGKVHGLLALSLVGKGSREHGRVEAAWYDREEASIDIMLAKDWMEFEDRTVQYSRFRRIQDTRLYDQI